jgi:hypothetical protein
MNTSASHIGEEGDVGGTNSASAAVGARTITISPSRVRCSQVMSCPEPWGWNFCGAQLSIEAELFGEEALKLRLRQQYGAQFNGFAVEEQLGRLREQLLPLFERVNRQLLQHLQALQRPRPGSSPMVAIGRAGHVNVAQQQVHLQRRASNASPPVDP